ncbi:hypothetical protein ACFY9Q_10110 [Streptomyces sp. NPDC012389]|uniref:hypothetical protein n=1 Tax=unclassified Streptomyces TaxID=2593676 RepID=UPI00081F552B|nr:MULTISPECIES: hypothetical protein [unclassified Streptomyces]MYR92393.1 hypothetical protein [Streptomyces sp. SID4937]SCD33078.1 hypothetical protein GA0115243_10119 [Streptomyces sp. ScaeMP-e83]
MTEPSAALWWLPVGAGGRVVVRTSRWWEELAARREHREPRPLFHAALDVFSDGGRHVIEMGPAWGQTSPSRGVVAAGPVGWRPLGRWRLFRYEVRCWPEGVLPDRDLAVGAPRQFALTPDGARSLLARVSTVPALTWGRDAFGSGDMWNSNSLISWLLHTSGVDATRITPPGTGRAPGWACGIAAARATADCDT